MFLVGEGLERGESGCSSLAESELAESGCSWGEEVAGEVEGPCWLEHAILTQIFPSGGLSLAPCGSITHVAFSCFL